jgi:hypothetical protein
MWSETSQYSEQSPEIRKRSVRVVVDFEHEHASPWSAIISIASKIGCTPQTRNE